jgi:hypothetical protein
MLKYFYMNSNKYGHQMITNKVTIFYLKMKFINVLNTNSYSYQKNIKIYHGVSCIKRAICNLMCCTSIVYQNCIAKTPSMIIIKNKITCF